MNFCQECGTKNENGTNFCASCGAKMGTGGTPHVATHAVKGKPGGLGDFFAFRTMISSKMIRLMYVLGMLAVTFYGFTVMFSDSYSWMYGDIQWMVGLGILILGNLFWRVACESMILFFSINDILASIEAQNKRI